jgi:hypothetical protein
MHQKSHATNSQFNSQLEVLSRYMPLAEIYTIYDKFETLKNIPQMTSPEPHFLHVMWFVTNVM